MHTTSGRWRLGLSLALITATFWGLLPIALKMALQGVDPFTITWYRFAVSSLVLLLILGATRRLPSTSKIARSDWILLGIALAGLLGNYVMYIIALQYASPTVNQTVIQLAPLFLLFGGLALFRERFTRLQWLGVAVLLPGLLLFFNRRLPEITNAAEGLGLGVALLVGAAVVWAAYGLAQKQLLRRMTSQQILLMLYLGAVAVLLPISHPLSIARLDATQLWILAFCCANTLIGYGCFAEALEHWEVSRVSAVLALSPIVTLVGMGAMARLAPGTIAPEQLNGASVAGALLVVTGSVLCALGVQGAERAPATQRNGPLTS